MKASEVRLGNLVLDTKGNINVVDLEALTYMSKEPLNQVTPIILTEEWLKNFGFKMYGSRYFINDKCKIFIFIQRYLDAYSPLTVGNFYIGTYTISKKIEYTDTEIKYVHQLQNLYSSIGEELT
jgi:hypothetical protein